MFFSAVVSYTFIIINIMLGLESVILNTFVIIFYYPKRQNTIPFVYVVVGLFDFLTGITSLVHSVILICDVALVDAEEEPTIFGLFSIGIILAAVTSRTSIYCNVVLAVIRTINIVRPFYCINRDLVTRIFILYPLGWLFLSSVHMVVLSRHSSVGFSEAYFRLFNPAHGLYLSLIHI